MSRQKMETAYTQNVLILKMANNCHYEILNAEWQHKPLTQTCDLIKKIKLNQLVFQEGKYANL